MTHAAAVSARGSALLAGLLAVGLAAPAAAMDLNGFFPPKGGGDVAVSYTVESYDHFWVGDQLVSAPPLGEIETASLSVWFDYGITDRLALVANVPSVDVSSDGTEGFGENGLQDLTVLLKARLASGGGAVRHGLSGAAGVRTPLTDYDANLPVDIGDGTTDVLLRLVYQLEAGRFYLSQQVGYDLRGDDAPDGLPLYTEVGYTAGRVTFSGFYSQVTADGGTDIGDDGFTFPSNGDEYQRLGGKVYARLSDRFGLSASGFTTLDGRNTGDTSGFSAGGSWRF
jgi:hypothetical protein